LAESLFRVLALEEGLAVEVRSAGIYASKGGAMSRNSQLILQEREIAHHFSSTPVGEEAVVWADLILTMTEGHKFDLAQRYPEAQTKIFTLKEFVLIDEQVEQVLDEMNQIYAEIELQFSLGQDVREEQRARLYALEKQLPSLDIVDPFAGSLDMYRQCALDIENHLRLLVQKLKK
jgi:protein-tyrosine phosphatase